MPRLLEELAIARADGRYLKVLRMIAKLDLLVLDDRGLINPSLTVKVTINL